MRKTYSGRVTRLSPNQIFVFGANTEFRHGKGAALQALKFGAKYGVGGYVGQTWSIVTKNLSKKNHPSITKECIISQIRNLYKFAKINTDKEFLIAYSGTGSNLNGYSNIEMAEMFSSFDIPDNIIFEDEFNNLISKQNSLSS